MINMANAASTQAIEEAKRRLRDFLEASESAGSSSMTSNASSASSGGQRRKRNGGRIDAYEMSSMRSVKQQQGIELGSSGDGEGEVEGDDDDGGGFDDDVRPAGDHGG